MNRKSYVGLMMRDVLKQWKWYLASTLAAVGYLLVDLYVRNMTGVVTDAVLTQSAAFVPLLVAMLLAYLGETPFHGIATYTKATMSQKVMRDLRLRIGEKVMRISLPKLAGERTGDIIARIGSEMETLDDFIYYGLSFVTTLVVQGISTFWVMLIADWQLTLILLGGTLVCIPVSYFLTKKVQGRELAARKALGRATQSAHQGFGALDVIKSFRAEGQAKAQYAQAVAEAAGQEVKVARETSWMQAAGWALGLLPLFIMLIIGAFRISGGTLSIGALMSLSIVGTGFCSFLRDTPENIVYLRRAAASCERIYSFLELPEETGGGNTQPRDEETVLRMEGVSYKYGEREALKDFSFALKQGGSIALVGSSGSGKSTVLRLLCGFLTPKTGAASAFGVPLEKWDIAALRGRIGVVFQESYLFPGTLRENLCTAKEDATDGELMDACRRAGLAALVEERGLDFMVGERGGKTSGGERQRIAVARALLKDAPLLFLDEPTSALDAESEKLVLKALSTLMQGRGVVIATHRLNLAAYAEQVLVLENGRVVEAGTHRELLHRGGAYARMAAEQQLFDGEAVE